MAKPDQFPAATKPDGAASLLKKPDAASLLMKPDGAASLLSLCTGTVKCIPKDGSCLFSAALLELKRLLCDPSMPYTLLAHHTAYGLRKQCAAWVSLHSDDTYEGLSLGDWIKHETNESVAEYVERMSLANEWGGVVELFAISRLFGVSVWVYEPVKPERAPLNAGSVCYMRRTHVFDGAAAASATAPTAVSQQAASGAVCLLYNGVNHYDVFSPAVGATLHAIASLLGAEAASGARGAEAVRHSQQLLRCSDDLDLSSFGPRGPPVVPPSPTHLRGGGGGGGGGLGGGFGSAFGPEQHALLVEHEQQQQRRQRREGAAAASLQPPRRRGTRRGMTSEDEPCADGRCDDHPLLQAGSPLVSPPGSGRGGSSLPSPSPRVVPPRPLVRDQRRLPKPPTAPSAAKRRFLLVRPWRWQRRRRQPASCEACCKEVKV